MLHAEQEMKQFRVAANNIPAPPDQGGTFQSGWSSPCKICTASSLADNSLVIA